MTGLTSIVCLLTVQLVTLHLIFCGLEDSLRLQSFFYYRRFITSQVQSMYIYTHVHVCVLRKYLFLLFTIMSLLASYCKSKRRLMTFIVIIHHSLPTRHNVIHLLEKKNPSVRLVYSKPTREMDRESCQTTNNNKLACNLL